MKFCLLYQIYTLCILLCLAPSCKKELPPCNGNCTDIVFAGKIYDATNNQPIPNQTVSILLHPTAYCVICDPYVLPSAKSGNNGNFELSTSFDTTLLRSNYIIVRVNTPPNFLQYATGPNTNAPSNNPKDYRFYQPIDLNTLTNLKFGFYPKATLQINMHRTSAIIKDQSDLLLEVKFLDSTNNSSILGFIQSASNKDTSFIIYTTANIFTKITSSKFVTETQLINKSDSIKCDATKHSSIDFYY